MSRTVRAVRPRNGEIGATAGHSGESLHFVIALEIVHVAHRNTHAMRVSAAMHFAISRTMKPTLIGKWSHLSCLDLFHDLVKVELTESIDTGCNQNDVLLALHTVEPVERVIQSIEKIRLCKPGMRNWFSAP